MFISSVQLKILNQIDRLILFCLEHCLWEIRFSFDLFNSNLIQFNFLLHLVLSWALCLGGDDKTKLRQHFCLPFLITLLTAENKQRIQTQIQIQIQHIWNWKQLGWGNPMSCLLKCFLPRHCRHPQVWQDSLFDHGETPQAQEVHIDLLLSYKYRQVLWVQ